VPGEAAPAQSIERGFASRPIEGASGLVYMRARHYDPTTGRFLQPDPEGIASTQRYAFAEHNPYIYNDPTGRSSRGIGSLDRGVPSWAFEGGGVLANNSGGPFMLNDGPTLQTQTMMNAMGSANVSQSVTGAFGVPVVPGGGSYRTELFIAAESALGLAGDGRGFDAAPNPSDSRAFFTLDFESGAGSFQINPSCASGGGSCNSALPIGAGNTFNTSISGNSITVTGSLMNSKTVILGRPAGPSIDFSMTFRASSSGATFSGSRNAYPSYEITRGSTFLYRGRETNPLRLFDATGMVRFQGQLSP